MSAQNYVDGVLVESWDDTTRTYTDHRTDPDTTRPYTPDENAAADATAADAAAAAEHAATHERIKAIVDDLQAEKDRLQLIIDMDNADVNANPAGPIKDSARAGKRIADAAIDLAKFVDGK